MRLTMFRSWRNTITSDEGFALKVLGGRGGLRYREGNRSVDIDSEFSGGTKGVILYLDSIKWWVSPDGRQEISHAERLRIAANVERAFAADGYVLEVV